MYHLLVCGPFQGANRKPLSTEMEMGSELRMRGSCPCWGGTYRALGEADSGDGLGVVRDCDQIQCDNRYSCPLFPSSPSPPLRSSCQGKETRVDLHFEHLLTGGIVR